MRKILVSSALILSLILSGCSVVKETEEDLKRYEASFLNLFDTVTTIVGYAQTEEEFKEITQKLHDELLEYHQLYDIYNDYPDINNIKTINDNAGVSPVETDERITQLLLFSKKMYEETGGRVNAAMGSVLRLWHDAREEGVNNPENARLPDSDALSAASAHMGFEYIEIDEAASTVFITNPNTSLDVGAIAKGYAVERVCENAPSGFLLSVGGNVRGTGLKPTDQSPWTVGVQAPDSNEYLHTLYAGELSVVSSGDYQRYYTVDGERYHHIIDPGTLYPSEHWRAVTVVCRDSGVADALSTALFVMTQDEGQALLDKFEAQALWVDFGGEITYSPGFEEHIRT